ncbi:MAG: hypothetical protein AB7K09_10490 [Planctomycetota bacterium]
MIGRLVATTVATALLPLLFVLLATLHLHAAAAQGRPDVRTDERDVKVILGAAVRFDAIYQDSFYRSGSGKGFEFISAYFRLDIDFRFNDDGGVFASLATRRRDFNGSFGSGFPRTQGAVVGSENPTLEIDELFVEIRRMFNLDIAIRAGLAHFNLGVDTSADKLWEGHGSLWFDTRHGRGPAAFDRMHPIGIQARLSPERALTFDGWAAYLNRDLSNDANTVYITAVQATLTLESKATPVTGLQTPLNTGYKAAFIGGYARWFDQNGPDMEVIWAGLRLAASPEVMVYGEAAFEFGNEFSGEAAYGGFRYTFPDGAAFIDVSFWLLTGDDPLTFSKQEGFVSYGSISTTLAVDSADFGMGRHTNYSALKVFGSWRLDYHIRLQVAYANYNSQDSDSDGSPGQEIDAFFIYEAFAHVQVRAGGAYLFDSRIRAPATNPDGWLFMVSVLGDF